MIAAALLLAATPLAPPTAPGESPAGATAEQVGALVESLSAASRSERVRAERALIALGPAVAGRLPAADAPDAPTGAAAVAALERIRAALAAAPPLAAGPSRVRFAKLPRASMGALLDALAERTGNRLDVSHLPLNLLSEPAPDLSALAPEGDASDGAATFWQVLNAVAPGRFAVGEVKSGALSLTPLPNAATTDAPDQVAKVTESGPVRVELGPIAVRPRFGTGGVLWRVPVRFVAEPRLRPLFIRPVGDGLTASAGANGDGPALVPFNPAASREAGFAGGAAAFAVDLFPPEDETIPEAAVTFGGSYELTFLPGDRRFTFAPTETGTSETADGVTVRLDRLVRAVDGVAVSAAVLHAGDADGPAFESHQTWRYAVRLRLRGADGTTIAPTAPPQIASEGAAALAVAARFAPPAGFEATAVEIVAPAAPATATVRFSGLAAPVGSR